MDEDGNGLDDEVETEIASCVAPEFRFDSHENATFTGEPHLVWNMSRVPVTPDAGNVSPDAALLKMRMGFVWATDGGFVDCVFDNAHDGDTQGMWAHVEVVRGVDRYYARLTHLRVDVEIANPSLDPFFPDDYYPDQFPTFAVGRDGTRPAVFPSAGKHHWYMSPRDYDYYLDAPGNCTEHAHGDGKWIVPPVDEGHLPLFWSWPIEERFPIRSAVVPPAPDGTWTRACALRGVPDAGSATHLRSWRLNDWGFDATVFDPIFRSFGVSGVGSLLEASPDEIVALRNMDGDGLFETTAMVPDSAKLAQGELAVFSWSANDPCPLTNVSLGDADGDGIDDACDPDPQFRQTYVGSGSEAYLAANDLDRHGATGPWYAYSGTRAPATFGGYLDDDGDGWPDGVDRCPGRTGPGAPESANHWGEDANWPPGQTTKGISNYDMGLFVRGDACDPYAAATADWGEPTDGSGSGDGKCSPRIVTQVGTNDRHVDVSVRRGTSTNMPLLEAAIEQLHAVPHDVNVYRCACRGPGGAALYDETSCLDAFGSFCSRATLLPALPSAPPGTGWRSVDSAGCSRNSDGYCGTHKIPIAADASPVFFQAPWDWTSEAKTYPSHFATGDLLSATSTVHPGQQYLGSAVWFASWAQVETAPAKYFAAAPRHLPDPEIVDPELRDPLGDKSRRLRAGFGASLVPLEQPHDVPISPNACVSFLPAKFWELAIWRPDPPWERVLRDPDVVARGLAFGGPTLADTLVVRPVRPSWARVRLGAGAASLGIAGATGPSVMLTRSATPAAPPSAAPLAAVPGEPDLLWVEIAPENARWARLSVLDARATELVYDVVASGTIPSGVAPTARLVADLGGGYAALVDLASGRVAGFDVARGHWMERGATLGAVAGRVDAGLALVGPSLYVAAGRSAAAVMTDLWKIDVLGRESTRVATGLPARLGMKLARAVDRPALLAAGGRDAAGAVHDDVWAVDLTAPSSSPAIRKLRADSGQGYDVAGAWLWGTAGGDRLVSWAFSGTPATLVERSRGDGGWKVADGAPACASTDARGGERCAVAAPWWATPGERACSTGSKLRACGGAPGELLASQAVSAPGALAIAAEERALWSLSAGALDRWPVLAGQVVGGSQRVVLPGRGRDVATRGGVALVATDAGVVAVVPGAGMLRASAPAPLCGRPIRVTPLGDTTWAVATTLGVAIVDTRSGSPVVIGGSKLDAAAGRMDGAPIVRLVCDLLDGALGTAGARVVEDSGALVAVSPARLLAARGGWLFDIDTTSPAAPKLRGATRTGDALRALRFDPSSDRAYGVGHPVLNAGKASLPILDVRAGAPVRRGEHDVAAWVERRDAPGYSARLDGSKIVLAQVAR